MSNHLSERQFAKCFIGRPTSWEQQHLKECPECSAELDRIGNTILSFRIAVRDRIDDRVALHAPGVFPLTVQPVAAGIPMWRWALVAAGVVVLIVVPFLTRQTEPQVVIEKAPTEMNPDALMQAVQRHLSRTIPAPMERVRVLVPNDESITESGGVQ